MVCLGWSPGVDRFPDVKWVLDVGRFVGFSSKAVADALLQKDGGANTEKGPQGHNAGQAPEVEGSVPSENSPEAEGSQASKSSGSELSRKEYQELQRERLASFLSKARNRTADEAVTADALKVAGYLARSDTPLTVKDILQFARYKTKDKTVPIVDWGNNLTRN